jgi:hypothetical protein
MLFPFFFVIIIAIVELDDVMGFDDIVHMNVQNTLDSVGVGE